MRLTALEVDGCYTYDSEGPARVVVCSTGPSRTLLTDPTLVGPAYIDLVAQAAAESVSKAAEVDRRLETALAGDGHDVLVILRGGLTFALDRALARRGATPTVSFIGTDRGPEGETGLCYLRPEALGGLMAFGDIVATGKTVSLALRTIREWGRPRHLLIVTMAAASGVAAIQRALAESHPETAATIVVLEAVFQLPGTGLPGLPQHHFDFLRTGYAPTLEFERARLSKLDSLFEKCAIYDGGMRAFSPSAHLALRRTWWAGLAEDKLVTLEQLAAHVGGLGDYLLPYEEWRVRAPVEADEGGLREMHRLGRAAAEFARETSLDQYVTGLEPS
ncbi:phosphoribosyltransferase [Nonomuraea sp. SBT364]|uniref:phosphoribosyltransferase n=1 Tax=Nonomuraea sp. SBT364 TaxID=1580530 RepID=UPI00066A8DBE|nr:phosphoribosyltransferase [Nonomuraea sp. SBT364]